MLSKTELLFLKGELSVKGNINYERVLTCRIKKKVEKRMRELEETVPLLSLKPQLKEWIDNYGITVIKKGEQSIDKQEMNLSQSVIAGPEGFEPTTYSLGGCRAIHITQTPTVYAAGHLLRYEPRPNIKLPKGFL